MNRFILNGYPQEINFDTDNTRITGAAETINFGALDNDRIRQDKPVF